MLGEEAVHVISEWALLAVLSPYHTYVKQSILVVDHLCEFHLNVLNYISSFFQSRQHSHSLFKSISFEMTILSI